MLPIYGRTISWSITTESKQWFKIDGDPHMARRNLHSPNISPHIRTISAIAVNRLSRDLVPLLPVNPLVGVSLIVLQAQQNVPPILRMLMHPPESESLLELPPAPQLLLVNLSYDRMGAISILQRKRIISSDIFGIGFNKTLL